MLKRAQFMHMPDRFPERILGMAMLLGVISPACFPGESPRPKADPNSSSASTFCPELEMAVRTRLEVGLNRVALCLTSDSTHLRIIRDHDGSILDQAQIYERGREHLNQSARLLNIPVEQDLIRVGGYQYDLFNPTELIIAASLVEAHLKNSFIKKNSIPPGAMARYEVDLPNLAKSISIGVEVAPPATDVSNLHHLHQTLESLHRYGIDTPRLAIIKQDNRRGEYRQDTQEIVFNRRQGSWALALAGFIRDRYPNFFESYRERLTRISGNFWNNLVEDDFDESIAAFLDRGYIVRRELRYHRRWGWEIEAQERVARYGLTERFFRFETTAHGQKFERPNIREGRFYQIRDYAPELGEDEIRVRLTPNLDPFTRVAFTVKDGDFVQVVGVPEDLPDHEAGQVHLFIPVVQAEKVGVQYRVKDPDKKGWIRGEEWLVNTSLN